MKYAKIVFSLIFIGYNHLMSSMDGKYQLTSPLTVARTMSCEKINQGVSLIPKVVANRNKIEESILFQEIYSHKIQGVLLTPKVLKDRFFEQNVRRRHAQGASEQELSTMVDDFNQQYNKHHIQVMKITAQHQKDKNQEQDSTNCCSLISNCFGIK